MAPRERRLVGLFGLTLVVCIFGMVGLQIASGLSALSAKNAATRAALHKLDEHAADLAAAKVGAEDKAAVIGDQAPPLASYLEGIANELGMQIPESTERPAVVKGKYRELSIDVKLRGVSLDQLSQFLKRVETRQPAVVTQRLWVKPYTSAHDKLDVELTIATWEKAKADKKPATGGKTDDRKSGSSSDKSGS
jgi:hypothetical protein